MNALNTIWSSFKGTIRGFDTSRQLALGVALGLLIGLLPKDSLLPYLIGLIAILSRANLLSLGVSGLCFSFLSPVLDPASHQLGHWLLTFSPLQSTWGWLYQLPVVPWTRFDNTVVTGSLLMGLMLCLPAYLLSFQFFERFGATLAKILMNSRLVTWLIGSPEPNPQKS
jgi:uncharacterized protein (TIGR03546 family)